MGLNNPVPRSLPSEAKKAAKVLSSFVKPNQVFGQDQVIPPGVLKKAHGLCVITVLKAGFLFSGRAGSGVIVARLPDGTWSAPSVIAMAGAGAGGLVGVELTDFVFILNDENAVKSYSEFGTITLGGNMAVSAGPLGRNAEYDAAASMGGVASVYSYSKSKGLFAGVSVEGSMIVERRDENRKAYGDNCTSKLILSGKVRPPPGTGALYRVLDSKAFNYDASYDDSSLYDDIPDDFSDINSIRGPTADHYYDDDDGYGRRGGGSGSYGRNDRGYDRDNRGYNRDDRGYGGDDRGYRRGDRGYGGNDRGYHRDDRGYGRDDRGYHRDDRNYDRDSTAGYSRGGPERGYDYDRRVDDRKGYYDRYDRPTQSRSPPLKNDNYPRDQTRPRYNDNDTNSRDGYYSNKLPSRRDDYGGSPRNTLNDRYGASPNRYGNTYSPPPHRGDYYERSNNSSNNNSNYNRPDPRNEQNIRNISDSLDRTHISSSNPPPQVNKLPQPPAPRVATTSPQAIALYDFAGIEKGDLSFKNGDTITIIKKTASQNDWWTGRINNIEGLFPANYVNIV